LSFFISEPPLSIVGEKVRAVWMGGVSRDPSLRSDDSKDNSNHALDDGEDNSNDRGYKDVRMLLV
jgi:hypothetical protein